VSAAYHPYPSGISEHVEHLAGALVELGVEVEILTTRFAEGHDDSSEPAPVVRVGRARLVPLNGSYATLPTGPRLPGQVRRYFAERSFDIVHCHGVFWPELSYWAIRHSKAVHVVSFLSAGFRSTTIGSGLHRRLFARHLARIDGRLALSQWARRTYSPYVPGDCRIIPSGVDPQRFRAAGDRVSGSGVGQPTVLFVGRLDARKGVDVLLSAMPLVRATVPTARLVVVGSGPGDRSARRRAEDLGIDRAVQFVGRASRAALPDWFRNADAFCSPARGGESFGIVLLEAMASGVPVVASDIPGYDETVARDRDGLLVPPGDPASLAAALTRILTDPALASRLRAAGLVNAARHAWPRIAAQTLAFYEELLAARRAAGCGSWPGDRGAG
jgi:phosphatidylinositol alpha-mannosyltransferase